MTEFTTARCILENIGVINTFNLINGTKVRAASFPSEEDAVLAYREICVGACMLFAEELCKARVEQHRCMITSDHSSRPAHLIIREIERPEDE